MFKGHHLKTGGFHGLLAALCLVVFMTGAGLAQVQPAPDPCDPQYYDSLKARAWLEAQREITQNQNLIFKPDSVLEYTCFDKHLDELAQHAIDMFSETKRWGTILPSTSMDTALDELVGLPVRNYVGANFAHTFLGGRSASLNYTPDTVSGGTYTCDRMDKVWMEAKCMDFIANQTNDGFYTFEDYASGDDKRFKPDLCGGPGGKWNDEIKTAYKNPPWTKDDLVTYLGNLSHDNCGQFPPIPTGLTVKNVNGQFTEKVCIQPGCHYNKNSGSCEKTIP